MDSKKGHFPAHVHTQGKSGCVLVPMPIYGSPQQAPNVARLQDFSRGL
jgi:hypothetical protein